MLNITKEQLKFKGDKAVWIILFIISVFSIMAIYSSSGDAAFENHGGNTEYFLYRRIRFLFFSWVLAFIVHNIPIKYIKLIAVSAFILILPFLIFNLFAGSRWMKLPVLGSIQFSEIAKYATLITTAWLLSYFKDRIKESKIFWITLTPAAIVSALIVVENGSSGGFVFISCAVLVFMGRAHSRDIFRLILLLIAIAILTYALATIIPHVGRLGTWKSRVDNYFFKPKTDKLDIDGKDFQIVRAKSAIATGGLNGKGIGKSTIRYILPEAHNDFIYAIIIEEYGSIIAVILLSLYLALLLRSIRIFYKSTYQFNGLVVLGIGFTISFQAMINMAVSTDAMFVTGQTLPALSQGGTSVFVTFMALGVLQAVTSQQNEPEEKSETKEDEEYSHA